MLTKNSQVVKFTVTTNSAPTSSVHRDDESGLTFLFRAPCLS